MANNNNELRAAVKRLRESMNVTQTELAAKMGRGMSTIQRWEQLVPPKGEALVQLMSLALAHGQNELAEVFRGALSQQLGYDVPLAPVLGERITHAPSCDVGAQHQILDTILTGGKFFKPEQDLWGELSEQVKYKLSKWQGVMAVTEGFLDALWKYVSAGASDEEILEELHPEDPESALSLARTMRMPGFKYIKPDLKKRFVEWEAQRGDE